MLLRAVVQVALDATPLGVGRATTRAREARSSSAWRCSSSSEACSAESSCTLCSASPTWRASSASTRSSAASSGAAGRRSATISPSSPPAFVIGATRSPAALPRSRSDLGQPHRQPMPAPRRPRGRRPTAPPVERISVRAVAVRVRRGALEHPVRARPHLGRVERQRPPQRLGELQQQLVERQRAGEARTERAQSLLGAGAVVVDEPGGGGCDAPPQRNPQQRARGRADRTEAQQPPLVPGRRATEREHDGGPDRGDQRGQPQQHDHLSDRVPQPAARGRGSQPGQDARHLSAFRCRRRWARGRRRPPRRACAPRARPPRRPVRHG